MKTRHTLYGYIISRQKQQFQTEGEEGEEEMNSVIRSKSTDRLSYKSNQRQDTRTGNPNQVNENENENDQR